MMSGDQENQPKVAVTTEWGSGAKSQQALSSHYASGPKSYFSRVRKATVSFQLVLVRNNSEMEGIETDPKEEKSLLSSFQYCWFSVLSCFNIARHLGKQYIQESLCIKKKEKKKTNPYALFRVLQWNGANSVDIYLRGIYQIHSHDTVWVVLP